MDKLLCFFKKEQIDAGDVYEDIEVEQRVIAERQTRMNKNLTILREDLY
jgi:hypothetical protein